MSGEIFTNIQKLIPDLTHAEKRIAKVILDEPANILHLSLTELGKKANVGDATIIRFCRKLKTKGYQDLKLSIAQNLPNVDNNQVDKKQGEIEEIMHSVMTINKRGIEDATAAIDIDQIDHAAESIINAKKIAFFGIGGSGLSAMDAYERFSMMGLTCYSQSDPFFQMLDAKHLDPNDVAIGVSYSGSKKMSIDAIKIAKEQGATTIGLIGRKNSPMAEYCDMVLCTGIRETPMIGGTFITKIAQAHVLDLLCSVVIAKIAKREGKSLEDTVKHYVKMFY